MTARHSWSPSTLDPPGFGAHRTSFGTRIRRTTIYTERPEPNSPSLWVRQASHPEYPFTPIDDLPRLAARLAGTAAVDPDEWLLGRGDETERRYPLPGSTSLASLLITGPGEAIDQPDWPATFSRLGALLADLHRAGRAESALLPGWEPPARRRLRDWWQQPEPTGVAFVSALSDAAADLLSSQLAADLRVGGTLVHGWVGLGVTVLGADGRLVCLLGEDLGTAPGEYDLGALLAQAIEISVFAPIGQALSPVACRDGLLNGYRAAGGNADLEAVDRFAIEHVARHVCDFVQFADFDPAELPRWVHLVDWLAGNR